MTRCILEITGRDADPFLQGLITNDLDRMGDGLLYAAILTPQGKFLFDMMIAQAPDGARADLVVLRLGVEPGADAGEAANRDNQAHAISRLIAEMSNVDVPNIGIIFGLGYSGGAIPLAASNVILSVRDGVFSTIQPKGLANIARRLKVPKEKVPVETLARYGNQSSASIPGAITDQLSGILVGERRTLVLSGFGVGLSWATMVLEAGPLENIHSESLENIPRAVDLNHESIVSLCSTSFIPSKGIVPVSGFR